jgi:hypothetical protein
VRRSRTWATLAVFGIASAACSAILDLQAPPSPDASAPVDATAPPLDAPAVLPDVLGFERDGAAAITPPVCTGLDGTYHALEIDGGASSGWTLFNTTGVHKRSQMFAGGAFDGRYVYFAPATSGVVTRFDTTNAAGFQDASSWAVFDVATLPGASGAGGFSGASFDGRYVYFVPHSLQMTATGLVMRFDPTGPLGDPASWALFDTATLPIDGGAVAKGFSGAASDGHYLYLVPNNDGVPDGRVVRYDTTRSANAPALDGGRPEDAGDAGTQDAGGIVPGSFADPSLWATFDVAATIPGAAGFIGGVFDGRSLYLIPSGNGGPVDNGASGIAVRFKTDAGFTTAASWSALDLTTINGEGYNFFGGAFDGRYVYFVPHTKGIVMRLDTTSSQPTLPAAWSVFNVAPLASSDAGPAQFGGAAFDGRFVYLVPSTAGFGTIARYDTLSTFNAACAWSTADLTQLDPGASFYVGAVFDGQYLYLVPRGNGLVARFDARMPASTPNLPAFHGSFY